MRSSTSRSRILVALAILACVALCGLGWLTASDLLCLAPALLLVATLLLRRYPGERLLVALVARTRRPARRLRQAQPSRRAPGAHVPRGGLLIACSLAVRPPPVRLLAS